MWISPSTWNCIRPLVSLAVIKPPRHAGSLGACGGLRLDGKPAGPLGKLPSMQVPDGPWGTSHRVWQCWRSTMGKDLKDYLIQLFWHRNKNIKAKEFISLLTLSVLATCHSLPIPGPCSAHYFIPPPTPELRFSRSRSVYGIWIPEWHLPCWIQNPDCSQALKLGLFIHSTLSTEQIFRKVLFQALVIQQWTKQTKILVLIKLSLSGKKINPS